MQRPDSIVRSGRAGLRAVPRRLRLSSTHTPLQLGARSMHRMPRQRGMRGRIQRPLPHRADARWNIQHVRGVHQRSRLWQQDWHRTHLQAHRRQMRQLSHRRSMRGFTRNLHLPALWSVRTMCGRPGLHTHQRPECLRGRCRLRRMHRGKPLRRYQPAGVQCPDAGRSGWRCPTEHVRPVRDQCQLP